MRIKITFEASYGNRVSFILPVVEGQTATQLVASVIATAQQVDRRTIGGYSGGAGANEEVYVATPTKGIAVELVDDETVMSAKQFAMLDADVRAEAARKAAEKAAADRLAAEQMEEQPVTA